MPRSRKPAKPRRLLDALSPAGIIQAQKLLADHPDITGPELAHRLRLSPGSGLGGRLLRELQGNPDPAPFEFPPDVRRRVHVRSALVSLVCGLALTDDFEEGLRTLIVEHAERVEEVGGEHQRLTLILWLAAPLIQGEEVPAGELQERLRLVGLVAMNGVGFCAEAAAWLAERQPELKERLDRLSVGDLPGR